MASQERDVRAGYRSVSLCASDRADGRFAEQRARARAFGLWIVEPVYTLHKAFSVFGFVLLMTQLL